MELDELPDGWELKPLSDPSVATLNPKKSEVSSLDARLEVTFVPMAAVDDGSGTIARPEVRRLGEVKKGYTYFKEGDVIFAKITPCMENGKSAIARGLRNGIGFGSTEFHVVRAGAKTQPEWLYLILRSQQVRDEAENAMHGAAGQQRVPIEFLEQLEIPLPPLAEQQRIVARVEALTRRLDQARQARQAALAEVENVMQSAVNTAFSLKNGDWEIETVETLCGRPQYGYTESATASPVGPHFLRITDIQDGKVDWETVPFCPCDYVEKYRLKTGDIVFARTGATTGKSFLVNNPPEAVFASYLIRIRPAPRILPEFLWWYFQSGDYWAAVETGTDDGNRPNMNGSKLAELEVPFPTSRDEQRAIVARLDALRGRLDELQRLQREVEAELSSFTPALLAKAFRGEL